MALNPPSRSWHRRPHESAPLTAEGTIVGTLQYMAPEQVEGKPADARTDLWALGAILYEMLTGKRAFEGTSAASLIGNIMNAEPAALSTLQPLTPPAVDRLVRQCLAKAPEDRPDTAHDVANDLRWIRESSGLAALTRRPTAPWPLAGAWMDGPRRPRRRPDRRCCHVDASTSRSGLSGCCSLVARCPAGR